MALSSRRPRLWLALAVLGGAIPLLGAAGCGAGSPPNPLRPCPPAGSASASGLAPKPPGSAAGEKAPPGPRLEITLRPVPDPSPRIHVEVVAEGASAAPRWRLDESASGALAALAASDARGALPVRQSPAPPGVLVTFDRAPAGAVRLAYDVDDAAAEGRRAYPMLTPAEMRASGEALLLLPESLDAAPVHVTLRIDAREIGASEVASSFGIGSPREVDVTGAALRRTHFLAGQLGSAVFRGWEGEDNAGWLGFTAFDPRAAAAELAQVRTAMRNFFGGGTWPETYLFVSHPRPRGSFRTAPRTASIFVEVGLDEPWTAPLRLALAKQLLHAWIGGQLWIGPADAEHEAEAHWFTEGFARYYATNLLLRFGTLAPEEYVAEIDAELSTQYASPHFGASNAALAAQRNEPAQALLVARGALYAARVNALVRKKSDGKRAVDQLVLELLERARKGQRVQPTSTWVDAVAAELGDAERGAFDRLVVQGAEISLPDGALGPCFRSGRARYGVYDLGFDEATAVAGARVAGTRKDGAARAAGLRDGDRVGKIKLARGDATTKVEISVEREGRPLSFAYLPVGVVREGQTWTRKKDVPDERCAEGARR